MVNSTLDDLAFLGFLLLLVSLLHLLTVARVSDVAQMTGVLCGYAQLLLRA